MLFIHAGVADHTMWDDQFAALAGGYRAIRFDAHMVNMEQPARCNALLRAFLDGIQNAS